jgi:hypothetical protein
VNRVQNVEGVSTVRLPSLRIAIGEVRHNLRALPYQREEIFYTELIELWYIYRLELRHLEELLLVSQHGFEEVLVEHRRWWQVKLDYIQTSVTH